MAKIATGKKTAPKAAKCPTCEGSGKQSLTVKMWGSKEPENVMPITCVVCKGTGTLGATEIRQLEAEKKMWCTCGNKSGEVDFFDDGAHPQIHKHHYRCRECGKVTQIG